MAELKNFNLWMEGYNCSGNSASAEFLGTFKANTFIEACDKWYETLSDDNKQYYKKDNNIVKFWGCQIYDNEFDARKTFG